MYNSLDQPFLSPHCAPYSGFSVRFHRFSQRSSSTDPELIRVVVEGWREEMHEEVEMVADEISDRISALSTPGGAWYG